MTITITDSMKACWDEDFARIMALSEEDRQKMMAYTSSQTSATGDLKAEFYA